MAKKTPKPTKEDFRVEALTMVTKYTHLIPVRVRPFVPIAVGAFIAALALRDE